MATYDRKTETLYLSSADLVDLIRKGEIDTQYSMDYTLQDIKKIKVED